MTNSTIRKINKSIATATKRLPVSAVVYKKPTKAQTCMYIIGGLVAYAVGLTAMCVASHPRIIPMPTFYVPTSEWAKSFT